MKTEFYCVETFRLLCSSLLLSYHDTFPDCQLSQYFDLSFVTFHLRIWHSSRNINKSVSNNALVERISPLGVFDKKKKNMNIFFQKYRWINSFRRIFRSKIIFSHLKSGENYFALSRVNVYGRGRFWCTAGLTFVRTFACWTKASNVSEQMKFNRMLWNFFPMPKLFFTWPSLPRNRWNVK